MIQELTTGTQGECLPMRHFLNHIVLVPSIEILAASQIRKGE